MDKFKNKYRIPSARLQNWDYGANGAYFITICTHNREHFFGEIVVSAGEPTMQLSEMGKLAEQHWMEIPTHFPFVELGNFVVMPNHTHGILIVDKNANVSDVGRDVDRDVETRLIASLTTAPPTTNPPEMEAPKNIGGFAGHKNPMLHENISRIIRWYKGRCSFEMRKIHADFQWQSRFHDHIIRDARSFEAIQTYITNNPMHWKNDKFHS